MGGVSYKQAGVDLDLYAQAMKRLPHWTHRTFSPRVVKLDGGFAGLFQLDFPSKLFARNYEDPILVAGTDGVGTKLKVASLVGRHNSIGVDLVAMCVNDIICCGAEPLFFLDYVAMSHDDPVRLEQIVEGISNGCIQAGCALLGGETAIMPDLYREGDYDLAGFCVGVVEKRHLIDGSFIVPGDVVLGISSNGVHSNGYSLVRKIVFEHAALNIEHTIDSMQTTVGDELLRPTHIYVPAITQVLNYYKVKNVVHGIAHITGGGLEENIARILPSGTAVTIDRKSWSVPGVFQWLQQLGTVDGAEMFRVFNMGIGMTLLVSSYYADSICRTIEHTGFNCQMIGTVTEGDGQVVVE